MTAVCCSFMDQDQDPYIREIQLAEVSNGIKKSPQWPPYHSLQAIPILKELVFSDLAKQPFFFCIHFFVKCFGILLLICLLHYYFHLPANFTHPKLPIILS